MIDLLKEYKQAKKELINMLNRLTEKDAEDKKQINSMIESCSKIIQWLETGRNPYFQNGIDVKKIYHIHYYEDMDMLPDIYEELRKEREQLELTPEKKQILIKVFNSLSDRERECFIMHVTESKSMQQIADELGIKKTTVQMYIKRAKEKITEIVQ